MINIDGTAQDETPIGPHHPRWKERVEYPESVNGIKIPVGHYWQNGKIRPVMKKPKAKRRRREF